MSSSNSSRNVLLSAIVIAVLVILLVGVTYAFFNYISTGNNNSVSTGRISFVSSEQGNITLSNVSPITRNEAETDSDNSSEVVITITGDTNYSEGIEYLVTVEDLNNETSTHKKIPIGIMITPEKDTTELGTANDNYFNNGVRGGNTSYYKVIKDDTAIEDGDYILVGYIRPGAAEVNGKIGIKAFIDADRIAVTDTYDGTETGSMRTTTAWVNGRVVLTTTEWNSFKNNSAVSFKVKVEANEGIWVENPFTPICRRATTLHTETCSQGSNYCAADGYTGGNTTVTYGNNPSTRVSGQLQTGDAFDCNVDGTGYNQRFYYVSPRWIPGTSTSSFDSNTAVLIYYSNTYEGTVSTNGAAYTLKTDAQAAGSESTDTSQNWLGPITAIKHLPKTTANGGTWQDLIIKDNNESKRKIIACSDVDCSSASTSTTGGSLPQNFSYEGYAGRLLTVPELKRAGCDTLSGNNSLEPTGSLGACNFLMEGTRYTNNNRETHGPWLENPYSTNSTNAFVVYSHNRDVGDSSVHNVIYGTRPVIEVPLYRISY